MEAEGIGLVLSRASELRSKINSCIDRASQQRQSEEGGDSNLISRRAVDGGDTDPDDDEEAESLLGIRDALESLEEQLASLQALQQQQRYERVETLSEIDRSRKILLKKLKEYKGEDLEVIREAAAFAGETVEHDDDLLLPPYPSRLPDSLILDESYHPHPIRNKPARNGLSGDLRPETKKGKGEESEKQQTQPATKNLLPGGIRHVFGLAVKTVLTLVSVVSILSLAGFEPRLRKRSILFKIPERFQKPAVEEARGVGIQCPPGKVLVMEDGKPRCLVKERVEIPFEPVVKTPNVSYGYG